MYKTAITLYLWCISFASQGQTTIRACVLDALTREPVVAATFGIEHQKNSGSTDTTGCFEVFVPENALLRIQCVGYKTWTGRLKAASARQTVLLEPSENALGEVVVSATMKEVSKDDAPIPVEVYTPKFFQKNATPSLFEALTIVNGVRPQLNCNVCNTGDIHINGMEGPYTMVTIDGMPIVSGLSTVYGLSGIPNGMVERVEVVKGPASTLYGSEAVGGVINVITKNAHTAPRGFLDAFGTSNGELNLDGALAQRIKKAHTLLGINYFRFQNRLDINDDNFTDATLQERVSVFNKWNFERKDNRVASMAARFIHENRWGGELQWQPRWRGTDSIYGESIYTHRIEWLGRYQLPTAKRRMMLEGSWNLHDQNSVYGTTVYLAQQQVAFAQFNSDIHLGKRHEALFGTALRLTVYDDNTPATRKPGGLGNRPINTWLPGIFVQDEWAINPQNRLLMGLRYDYNSAHGSILTPRLSWKWSHDALHTLRVTAGSGYRVANVFTEDHAALTGARELLIQEDLRPERSWNGNLNYVRKFFPRRAGFVGLDASVFYTYFFNQILPDYDTDPQKIIYKNLNGHAVSKGASLNLDFNFLNGLKIIAGLTYMDVYRLEKGQRREQLFAPPLSGTWTLSQPLPKCNISIDYTGNMSSPMLLPVLPQDYRPSRSPWFAIHNVQITKQLGVLDLYVGLKNVFGFYPREDVIMRAFDPFDRQTDVNNPNGYTFDPTYNYAPIQRQRAVLGIRAKF